MANGSRDPNKGQGRSFISNMRLPIGVNSIFFLKTHRLAIIHTLQTTGLCNTVA